MLEPLNGREPGPETPHLPWPLRLTGETEAPRKQGAALGPEGTRWTRADIGLPSAAAPWPVAGATCSPNSLSPVQVSVSQLNRYLDCSVSPQIDPGRQRLIKAVLGLPRQDLHRAEGRRRRALGSARSQASPPASHYQTGAGGLVVALPPGCHAARLASGACGAGGRRASSLGSVHNALVTACRGPDGGRARGAGGVTAGDPPPRAARRFPFLSPFPRPPVLGVTGRSPQPGGVPLEDRGRCSLSTGTWSRLWEAAAQEWGQ